MGLVFIYLPFGCQDITQEATQKSVYLIVNKAILLWPFWHRWHFIFASRLCLQNKQLSVVFFLISSNVFNTFTLLTPIPEPQSIPCFIFLDSHFIPDLCPPLHPWLWLGPWNFLHSCVSSCSRPPYPSPHHIPEPHFLPGAQNYYQGLLSLECERT